VDTPNRHDRDRMYQAALLKIAIKMRRDNYKGFDEIFSEILNDMHLDETEFRHYVNTHMQSLMATVKQRGY
jgi:Zn-dependent M16 (insulinase) family peptidase